jgi:hypothetical protein
VERDGRQPASLARGHAEPTSDHGRLRARGGPDDALSRPLQGCVDVVRERDGEAGAGPMGGVELEAAPQAIEGRIERVERRGRGAKAIMLVARPVALLDTGEVEEGLGEVVTLGPLPALDLGPGLFAVRQVVPEPEVARSDRVENPSGPPFDGLRDQRNTLLASRAAWTSPGLGSSRAKTAST